MRRQWRLARMLRCTDPASVMRSVFQARLQDMYLNEPVSFVGKTFRISLGESADEASVDLVT